MMVRQMLIGLLVLVLAGCAAVGGPRPQPVKHPAPARLLLAMPGDAGALALRPVDPDTLADRPESQPLPFGHHYSHAFSPDGHTLAAILWPSGQDNRGGALHIIDLDLWKDQATGVTLDDYTVALFFSQDSREVYWVQPTEHDPAHGVPVEYALFRYPLAGAAAVPVARLPRNFAPRQARPMAGGRHIAILGQPTDGGNLAMGEPRVLRLNLADGAVDADITLAGIAMGQSRSAEGEYQHADPGVAWDLTRDLLYVVEPAGERVTVVDLAAGKVKQRAEIGARSWLERLGLEKGAAAKMTAGTRRQAVLSPDGARLYVTGSRDEVSKADDGNWVWRSIPLGLTVIDTAGLRQVGRLDLPVSDLALAPDGRKLLLWGADFACEYNCRRNGHGVYLVEAERLKEQAHLLPENDSAFLGFSPDGRFAYLGEQVDAAPSGRFDHRVLNLSSGRLSAKREMAPGYAVYLQME